jgi:hypothetical protein
MFGIEMPYNVKGKVSRDFKIWSLVSFDRSHIATPYEAC